MSKYNPYQIICRGIDCKLYDKCDDLCILKSKNRLKGCNYSIEGDCEHCSHKKTCMLVKPYSDELYGIEIKRNILEKENKKLYEYIREWDKIENELDEYDVNSVTDIVYFDKNKQQMINRIMDNNKLIKLYLKKEKNLIN